MEISKAELQSAAAAQNTSSASEELMGSEILVKALQAENVKYLWGYPGGAVLHIYDALSGIIPKHFTVLDIGCAYAPQGWYFQGHHEYIAVDPTPERERFAFGNTTHIVATAAEFIAGHAARLDQSMTFAIWSVQCVQMSMTLL